MLPILFPGTHRVHMRTRMRMHMHTRAHAHTHTLIYLSIVSVSQKIAIVLTGAVGVHNIYDYGPIPSNCIIIGLYHTHTYTPGTHTLS